MSDIKKLRELLNWTQEQLAANLCTTTRTIQNWEAGNKIPKSKFASLEKLASQFPDENFSLFHCRKDMEVKTLKRHIRQSHSIMPDNGDDSFSNQMYREDDIPEKYMTWLVPMAAMGGSLIGFEDSGVRRDECEKIISPVAGADWAVPVCGDSMEPEYPNGSKVFVKRIDPGDFIVWGNVFVLDTTNGLIIKVVVQSDKKDCVRCVSLNQSGRYQPFDVPMRTIRAMYRVLLCVSIK